jgi:hypothetical protein
MVQFLWNKCFWQNLKIKLVGVEGQRMVTKVCTFDILRRFDMQRITKNATSQSILGVRSPSLAWSGARDQALANKHISK